MSAQCQSCGGKAPSRDETNNAVVSQTVEAHPKTAQNRAQKAGTATP